MNVELLDSVLPTLLIAAATGVVVALGAAIMRRRRRQRRRQNRLNVAFHRAKQARYAGSGVQGTPYSVYTETFPE